MNLTVIDPTKQAFCYEKICYFISSLIATANYGSKNAALHHHKDIIIGKCIHTFACMDCMWATENFTKGRISTKRHYVGHLCSTVFVSLAATLYRRVSSQIIVWGSGERING